MEYLILQVPSNYQLMVAILLIVWVSGIASAFIDNIPFTTMMIPVIKGLANNTEIGMTVIGRVLRLRRNTHWPEHISFDNLYFPHTDLGKLPIL